MSAAFVLSGVLHMSSNYLQMMLKSSFVIILAIARGS